MHGVMKYVGKDTNRCAMCKESPLVSTKKYIYKTWEILPELPAQELIICRKCAIRENGSKNKKNFDEIVRKRGENYGNIEKTV